jgi:hypothetical protein
VARDAAPVECPERRAAVRGENSRRRSAIHACRNTSTSTAVPPIANGSSIRNLKSDGIVPHQTHSV